MNRRGFFSALAAVAATAALDPEALLWKPGKLISIPKPVVITPGFFNLGDIITFEGHYDDKTGELRKYIVMAAGESFGNVRFQYAPGVIVMPAFPEPPRFSRDAFALTYPSIA